MAADAWDRGAEQPLEDVADQDTSVDPHESTDPAGAAQTGQDPSIEADPADVADQGRSACLDEQTQRG